MGEQTAGYRRSTGTARGQARRRALLEAVTQDLAVNGLVGFSLRRAARAAGTTHKVLLYHFESVDDLLVQAIAVLRQRRVARAVDAWERTGGSLADFVGAAWEALLGEESRVLDQAIGLVLYDSSRYAALGLGASEEYLPTLMSRCPPGWPVERKEQMAHLILGALRGFLIERATSPNPAGVQAGLAALRRAVEREERAGSRAGKSASG